MTVASTSGPAGMSTAGPLGVFADLRIEADGQRAHLIGDGQSLVLHTNQPLRLCSAVAHAPLPAGVARANGALALGMAAGTLRAAGLTVDVTGPDGVLIRLGGNGSRAGRLLTGSHAVAFGSLPVLWTTLTARVPPRRVALGAATIVAAAAGIALTRRRR